MIYHGDALDVLKTLEDDSVDLLCTDPPYGYGFMQKAWDKALPDIGIFKETLRVLKPGAFAFVMSAPRSDVCSRMSLLLEEAGFNIAFTPIYWTYASGFPKAMNIGKMVDKRGGKDWNEQKQVALYLRERMAKKNIRIADLNRLFSTVAKANHWTAADANNFCMPTLSDYERLKLILDLDNRFDELIEREAAEREILGTKAVSRVLDGSAYSGGNVKAGEVDITTPATDAAKALDGSYGGFQPKPAVEVIIVAMKPLSEKTYVDQALKNGKGITWLDDCRVPIGTEKNTLRPATGRGYEGGWKNLEVSGSETGRFPANLLVSDDVLNDGTPQRTDYARGSKKQYNASSYQVAYEGSRGFNGEVPTSYSRYFDLDAWAQTLPFLAVPKASKSEKNVGLDGFEERETYNLGHKDNPGRKAPKKSLPRANFHPTVKPLKLMSYLITLGSRPGDLVLDPFAGSGSTLIAAKQLGRNYIGVEREREYCDIAEARLAAVHPTLLTQPTVENKG